MIDNPQIELDEPDGAHRRARLPHRRHHLRPLRHPRSLPHGPRQAHRPRQATRSRNSRTAAPRSSSPTCPYQQTKETLLRKVAEQIENGPHPRRGRRARRRVRPQEPCPHRGQAQARRRPHRHPQPALPVHAASRHLQHHHAGPGRWPAPHDAPEGDPALLPRPPRQRHPPPHPVPAPPGPGPLPHRRRPLDRASLHRRDHPRHPRLGQSRPRPAPA